MIFPSKRIKLISCRNDSIFAWNCKTNNFSHMTPCTLNFIAVIFLKYKTRTLFSCWKAEGPQMLSYCNFWSKQVRELRTIKFCNKNRSKNKWRLWWTFRAGITKKMLLQFWKQCTIWLLFTTTKILLYYSSVVKSST